VKQLAGTTYSEAYDACLRGLLLKHAALQPLPPSSRSRMKAIVFMARCSLEPPILPSLARFPLVPRATRLSYANRYYTATAARGDPRNVLWRMPQKLAPNSPETLLALGYYHKVLLIVGWPKPVDRVTKFTRATASAHS